jgi:hypothetical protein
MNQNNQQAQSNIQQLIKNGYQQQPAKMPQPRQVVAQNYLQPVNPQLKLNQKKQRSKNLNFDFLNNKSTKNIILGVVSVFAVALIAFLVISSGLLGPFGETADERERREIISEISSIAVVPVDAPFESVTVAKINDINLILSNSENASFFENGSNGDYFVIYNNNSKVVLYRREVRKIVNIASTKPQEISPGGITQP